MAAEKHTDTIPFEDFIAHAAALFDEVASGRSVTVEQDGQLIRLSSVRRPKRRPRRESSLDDPLRDIVGIGHYTGPTDVSSNKHKYLADAAADLHEPQDA